MESKSLAFLITGFVLLIVGVSLLTPTAEIVLGQTDKLGISNEALDISSARINAAGNINETLEFTVTNNPTGWKSEDCPLTNFVYGNSTTDYTLTTDYLVTLSTGVFTLKNTTTTISGTNSTLADYTYCADDYLNSSWQRTVLNLVPGFFAIALLLIAVGLFYSVGKSEGVID